MAEEGTETVVVEPVAPQEALEDYVPKSTSEAIRVVLRKSLEVNGLIRGLSEVARSLDRRSSHLCILAEDCDDAEYKKLIDALCKQNHIDLVMVQERAKLAEWAGLCKMDRAGNVKKVYKCSCVAIRDFGVRSRSLDVLLEHISSNASE